MYALVSWWSDHAIPGLIPGQTECSFWRGGLEERSGFNPEVVPVTDLDSLDPGLDRMLVWHQYGAAERGLSDLAFLKILKKKSRKVRPNSLIVPY